MKPIGWIYLTTNLINEKIYIGQHVISSDKRANATYIGSGELFRRAVKKYGKENFKRKILKVCYTQKELNTWEYVYIKKYKSQDKDIGYNIADGDILSSKCNPAKLPEVRKKISESAKERFKNPFNHPSLGRKNPHTDEWKKKHSKMMIGRKHSEETKRKISDAQKGSKNHMYGKHLSEETKKKLSLAFSGKNNPMYGVRICGERHHFYGSKFVWINNGIVNKRGKINEPIPNGWVKGKIQKSKKYVESNKN